MSIPNNQFPSLSDLIKFPDLPVDISGIQNGFDSIIGDLYYKNYIFNKTPNGDVANHRLTLISFKRIGFEIPGAGLVVSLNPGLTEDGITSSEFDVSFNYRFQLLKLIKNFDVQSFSESPLDLFKIIIDFFGISEKDFMNELIFELFPGSNSHAGFVADYNDKHPTEPLTLSTLYGVDETENLLSQIEGYGQNIINLLFEDFLDEPDIDDTFRKIKKVCNRWLSKIEKDDVLKLLLPSIEASVNNLNIGIEFPETIFQPVDTSIPKTILTFDVGSVRYSTEAGFEFESESAFNFPKSTILNSGFTLELTDLKLDLSRTKNIPEAIADGRPDDFVGVYIKDGTVGFPAFWNHDDGASTGELKVSNLLVGTGGISGTIALQAKSGVTSAPLISAKFGNDFVVTLDAFDITFQQNAIIGSNIHGTMKIPGFKDTTGAQAIINIDVHIGTDGDFSVTASSVQSISAISIPGIFDLEISSLAIGRNDDRFYVAVSGLLDFHPQGNIGQFLPNDIEIKRLLIYDDGTFEFEGGALIFPKAYTFKMGPAELAVTAIHLGTHEQEHNTHLRKYKYFGFDGGVSLNPGGVDARGKGIKFYFTIDNDLYAGDSHVFFRIQSLAIDIMLPGDTDPENATLILKGYLAMQEPTIPSSVTDPDDIAALKNSTEYAGTVSFEMPKLRGMSGSAAMRFNPDLPSFIVDIGVEIAQPIVLGATGLGIYGFRALVGRRYVTSKSYAGLPEDAEWWQYYKAKVSPDYKEGVQISKFGPEDGTSFGAGVSLATVADAGKAFSSKLFLLLGLPDVLLFQGQAQILKQRVGLDTLPDPPFFAFVALSDASVEAAFGVNYKLPDDGANPGKIVKVDGVTELGFFFGNSTAWYVNIGRETPAERRISARVFDLFNMYFYLMLSSNGMRAGAGASWELKKKFGPLKAELGAYLDVTGQVSRRPKQVGGSIRLGGNVGLYIFKFGFSFSVSAALAAEGTKPRIVTGEFELCIKVLKKDYCAHFDLTWNYDNALDTSEVPLIDAAALKDSGKSKHFLTADTINLFSTYHTGSAGASFSDIPAPSTWAGGVDQYIIPLDSYVDLEFRKGMYVSGSGPGLNKYGGVTGGANNIDFVAPQRGKSDRVRHEYTLNRVEIVYYDSNSTSGGTWKEYNFYDALTPQLDAGFVDDTALANLKYGYWQIDKPGNYNKLKILAQDPLSYITTGGVLPEDFGVTDETIFCPEDPIEKTCINFNDQRIVPAVIASDVFTFYKDILFQIVGADGTIVFKPYLGFPNALSIKGGDSLEIYFKEPIACVSMLLQTMAANVTVEFYERVSSIPASLSDLPSFSYNLVTSGVYTSAMLSSAVEYEHTAHANKAIEKIIIKAGQCGPLPIGETLYCTAPVTTAGLALQNFFNALLFNQHLLPSGRAVLLYPAFQQEYSQRFFNTVLYNKPLDIGDTVVYTSTYVNNKEMLINITDEMGYDNTMPLKYTGNDSRFAFSGIRRFSNMRANPAGRVEGQNYLFLVDVEVESQGARVTFTLEGSSIYSMGECSRQCSTFLYQFCYLSLEDELYNETIPDAATVAANNASMIDGITKTLQPVWRPNTIYAVRVEVTDSLYREGESSTIASYTNTFIYGFKTTGPVGHHHIYPTTSNDETPKPEFSALAANDREAEFKIHNLGLYIDYPKCYPNADSDLINAKPFYYKNPKLRVFYNKAYVYQFYNNWDQYGTAEAIESGLETLIKDPAEKPFTGTTVTSATAGITSWITTHGLIDPEAMSIPVSTSLLSNMLENGNDCYSAPAPLLPIAMANEITFEDLLPKKLYTVLMNAKYRRALTDTDTFVREVHRYSFETSRYGDFAEQINSYILKSHDESGLTVIDKAAIYTHEQLIPSTDISEAQLFVVNPASVSANLLQEYMHPYDRLIDGILKIKRSLSIDAPPPADVQTQPLPPAVTTEFNFIRNSDPASNKLLGILLRSPEPFNDPKIPANILETSIVVEHTSPSSLYTNDYKLFFSKDNAKVFITKTDGSLNMPQTGTYKITFTYLQYNGNEYAVVGTPVEVLIEL